MYIFQMGVKHTTIGRTRKKAMELGGRRVRHFFLLSPQGHWLAGKQDQGDDEEYSSPRVVSNGMGALRNSGRAAD